MRSDNKNIILQHDPYLNGDKFIKWIKTFKHTFLALNVKEEGPEDKILKILKKRYRIFFSRSNIFNTSKKSK